MAKTRRRRARPTPIHMEACPIACAPIDGARAWSARVLCASPKPKGNSKRIVSFGRRCPKCNRGQPSIQATDADVLNEKTLTAALSTVAPLDTFVVPVVLHASVVLPIRPSWNAAKQRAAEIRASTFALADGTLGFGLPCSAKGATGPIPDLVNLIKLLEDSMEKAGWLSNDSLIAQHRTEKIYGPEPGYSILIRELP